MHSLIRGVAPRSMHQDTEHSVHAIFFAGNLLRVSCAAVTFVDDDAITVATLTSWQSHWPQSAIRGSLRRLTVDHPPRGPRSKLQALAAVDSVTTSR
jgi:hypothetical protein